MDLRKKARRFWNEHCCHGGGCDGHDWEFALLRLLEEVRNGVARTTPDPTTVQEG
jgi:hypothetical protein